MKTTIIKASSKIRLILNWLIVLLTIQEGGFAFAAPSGSPWGDKYFPNVELTTQDGKKVRFYDDLLKNKVFAINFIYTECTDSCPMETAALRKVQKALGDRMGHDVFFYSISIDAKRDKPEKLKEYADRFHVAPGWLFLTGSKDDVALIRQKLGMYREDGKAEKTMSEHNVNILMGNEAAGQWIKRSPFEEPAALVRILTTRMQSGRALRTAQPLSAAVSMEHPGAERVPLDPTLESPGEKLFYSRCANCHSLEAAAADDIGPGLAGITKKRDHKWLKGWIKEPDKMIAKKDPASLALYKQYKGLPMPNMRLSDAEVESIISFMATQKTN